MQHPFTLKTLVLISSALLAQTAAASGYHFGTQSVTAQSTANAAAAEAADATTIFTNPAGLTHLESHQVSGTLNLVMPNIEYSDAQARHFNSSQSVMGSNSGKITDDVLAVPHIYGAYKLNDRVTLGLGVFIPYASSTEYDKDSVLRYNMNQLGLTTVSIQPTVAYQINDKHSVGLGLNAQYSKAQLRKFADWSASYSDRQLAGLAMLRQNPALANRTNWQGYGEVEGDDWGLGYQLGWMYDINERARIGINYRSKVEHNLKGDANWTADGIIAKANAASIQAPVSAGGRGYLAHEGASVKIVTPESLSLHGMYRATDKLNLFGDITWTRHSRFNQADLQFENVKVVNAQGDRSNRTVIKPNWRDTFKVALGGSYQYSEPLQLRAGIAFDQSPIRNAESRLNTLPDGNRIWFSAGVKYNFNKNHSIDAAYSHIHINDTTVNSAAATGQDVDSKGASSARFKNYANIFGVQYTYKF